MDNVLPVIGVTSIFYLAIACVYDIYLRSKFVYIRKDLFDDIYISKEEVAEGDWRDNSATFESIGNLGYLDTIGHFQPVIKLTMDGDIISANKLFCNMLNYTQHDIVGRAFYELIDPMVTTEDDNLLLWDKLHRGECSAGKYKLMGVPGKPEWIDATFIPINNENGVLQSVICLAKDISDKKLAIDAIEKQLTALAKGDLTSTLDIHIDREFKFIADTMNKLITTLRTLLSEVDGISKHVYASSLEISDNNNNLSNRNETQATSVQAISSAIDAFTQGIQNYAVEVKDITEKSTEAIRKLQGGEISLTDNVVNMQAINTSSIKIIENLDL